MRPLAGSKGRHLGPIQTFMQEAQQYCNCMQRNGGPNHFANQALLADLEATVREVLKENLPPIQQPPATQPPPAPSAPDDTMSYMLASTSKLMKHASAPPSAVSSTPFATTIL